MLLAEKLPQTIRVRRVLGTDLDVANLVRRPYHLEEVQRRADGFARFELTSAEPHRIENGVTLTGAVTRREDVREQDPDSRARCE